MNKESWLIFATNFFNVKNKRRIRAETLEKGVKYIRSSNKET